MLFGWCGPLCSEQKFCNARKVPLKNTFRGFSSDTIAVWGESGHYSWFPKGPRSPKGRNVLWGACAIDIQFLCSVPDYHVSEGLNILWCWCVLPVLIPEREKNQAVTLRSRPVKKHILFFLQRTDYLKNGHLSFFLIIQNTEIGLTRLFWIGN